MKNRCKKVLKRTGFILWMSFWGVLWVESSIWLMESPSLSIGVIGLNILASACFLAACVELAAQVRQ